jgi:hypothetical protein
MTKIAAMSQDIWKIPFAPAGGPEENNTLRTVMFQGSVSL